MQTRDCTPSRELLEDDNRHAELKVRPIPTKWPLLFPETSLGRLPVSAYFQPGEISNYGG